MTKVDNRRKISVSSRACVCVRVRVRKGVKLVECKRKRNIIAEQSKEKRI